MIGYLNGDQTNVIQRAYSSVPNDFDDNANAGGYAGGAVAPVPNPPTSGVDYHLLINATYIPAGDDGPPVPTITAPASTLT